MAQATYDRNAAIREVLTVVPAATIDPEKRRCEICFEQMEDANVASGESVQESPPVKLPCPHIYHQECITRWLTTSATCPACRAQVLPFPAPQLDSVTLEDWQMTRDEYLLQLLNSSGSAAYQAYWFIDQKTFGDELPSPDVQYVAEAVTDMPELITDEHLLSAWYYNECGRLRLVVDFDILAMLIRLGALNEG